MLNQYLMQLPRETSVAIYDLLGYLQWPAFAGMLFWATVKYRTPVKDKVVLWMSFIIARFWGGGMVPIVSRLTNGSIPAVNMGIAFGSVMIILAAIVYFLNTPVLFSLDVAVPTFILGRGLAIAGCIFAGCCHGFPVSWGIYSGMAETLTFPTVILDIVGSCAIVGCLILLSKKQNFSGNGTVAAIGMISFGLLRIIIDVLRDNRKLLFLLTVEGFCGILYAVSGYLLFRHIYYQRCNNVT